MASLREGRRTSHQSFCFALLVTAVVAANYALAVVPRDLSNWQNEYLCDNRTLIVRPKDIKDIQQAVKYHTEIRPNGLGHSWNQPFFCASPAAATAAGNGTAANIQLTTIRPLKIVVDETEETVTVDAGVMTYDLLDYLSNYVTEAAPLGWTLPAFPWFTFQTIGGAVATGTHGSSLAHASLSHQVVELTMVLANGTIHTFSNETEPFLMRAVRVSVGKLGVITSLKLRIVRETAVLRTLTTLKPGEFLDALRNASAQYRATGQLPRWCNESEVFWIVQKQEFMLVSFLRADEATAEQLPQVLADFQPDNTTLFPSKWLMYRMLRAASPSPESEEAAMAPMPEGPAPAGEGADIWPLDTDPVPLTPSGVTMAAQAELDTLMSTRINAPPKRVSAFGARVPNASISQAARGTAWPPPEQLLPNSFLASPGVAEGYMEANEVVLNSILKNGSVESRHAYASQPQSILGQIQSTLYDQYEVALPVATMDKCIAGLLREVYGDDLEGTDLELRKRDKGFRTAPLFRFVGQEEGLLAQTHDGPRVFINLEDYIFYNNGSKTNEIFKRAMGYLRSSRDCGTGGRGARLHWGKAGWPDPGCWHGDEEYPETWCDFGCASRELDPNNKFVGSASDRWTWQGVDLERCCTPAGFDTTIHGCTCTVRHERSLDSCPPSPFYSNR